MKIPLISCLSAICCLSSLGDSKEESAAVVTTTDTDHYTITRHLDPALLHRHQNFGYTDQEISQEFNYPQQFEYDTTGMAKGLVRPPPAAGVHPRVLFYSEDVPALRKKFATSKPGRQQMEAIRKAMQDLITGPQAKYKKLYEDAARGLGSREMATNVEPSCAIEYRGVPMPD